MVFEGVLVLKLTGLSVLEKLEVLLTKDGVLELKSLSCFGVDNLSHQAPLSLEAKDRGRSDFAVCKSRRLTFSIATLSLDAKECGR